MTPEFNLSDAQRDILLDLGELMGQRSTVAEVFAAFSARVLEVAAFDYTTLLVTESDPRFARVVGSYPFPLVAEVGDGRYSTKAAGFDVLASFPRGSEFDPADFDVESVRTLATYGYHRVWTNALVVDGVTYGAFSVARRSPDRFSPADRAFLRAATNIMAAAVRQDAQVAKLERQAARSRLLNELALLLNSGEPMQAMFDRFAALMQRAIDCDSILLALADPAGILRVAGAQPLFERQPGEPGDFAGGEVESVLAEGRRVVEFRTDYVSNPWTEAMSARGFRRGAVSILRANGQTLGLVSIGRESKLPFSGEDVAFLELVATLLEQAVNNHRRIEEARAAASRSQLLNELALLLSAGDSVDAIFQRMLNVLERAIQFDYVGLLAVTANPGQLRMVGSRPEIVRPAGALTSFQDAAIDQMFDTEGVVQYRSDRVAGGATGALLDAGIIRMAAVVLRHGSEPVGEFTLGRAGNVKYPPDECEFLLTVGSLLSQAIANQRRIERFEEEAEEQRTIAAVAAAASRESESTAILDACLEPLSRVVPGPRVSYAFLDLEAESYWLSYAPDVRLPMGALGREAIARGQTCHTVDVLEPGHPAFAAGVQSISLTTHHAGGVPVGLLSISSKQEGHIFSERDLHLFRELAKILGPSMEMARANEAARRRAEIYNLILNSLSEAVVLLDPRLKTVFANAGGERLINLVDPDRRMQTVDEHLPALTAALRDGFRAAVIDRKRSRGRTQVEVDGKTEWHDYELVPLEDPELGLLLVASDVTAEVKREEEQAKIRDQMAQTSRLAALGELIGGVAHELNNPLTAILGFAQVMARSEAGEQRSEEISIILKESLRARNIVRDLLFISRPGPVEQARIRVGELIAHVERLRRSAWARKQIEVTISVSPDLARTQLWGNENQITQVLLNLVTNAEHAVADVLEKRIGIDFSVSAVDGIVMDVSDNGHGMDDATAGRVFEPFFTTKQGQGTGLGLSMSYSIVAAHHGRIEVTSAPARGTRFRVILPPHTPSPAEASSAADEPRRARVLVIDDEPSLRRVCQRLIASMGHDCVVAESSATALALAAETEFDLILCDYRLYAETADDVIQGLRDLNPALLPRVVIATGATTDPGVVALIATHQLRLLAKPYGYDDIAALIALIPNSSAV